MSVEFDHDLKAEARQRYEWELETREYERERRRMQFEQHAQWMADSHSAVACRAATLEAQVQQAATWSRIADALEKLAAK